MDCGANRVFHLRTGSSSKGAVDVLWEGWESGSESADREEIATVRPGLTAIHAHPARLRRLAQGDTQEPDIHISFLTCYYFF